MTQLTVLAGCARLATVPVWKDYQEETAAYYRALGLSAQTDQRIDGARSTHKVDVAVRGYRAAVEFLWIVECKYWNRRVSKSAVATLSSIVQDVGADRGLILSRRGFQPGATALAQKSNITLTSLSELQADTADEYVQCQCGLLSKRCQAAVDTINARTIITLATGTMRASDPPGAGYVGHFMLGRISLLQRAVRAARNGKWPFNIKIVSLARGVSRMQCAADAAEMNIRVNNVDELAQWIGTAMDSIEREIGVNGD
jgi:hypothetical protein